MNASVVLVMFVVSVFHTPTTQVSPAPIVYFSHIDLCEAAKKIIVDQVQKAGGTIVASCHFLTGAAPK